MIPECGQTISVVFRNGIQIDGEVVSWSDNKSVLKSLTGSSTLVINKTLDDILYYKFADARTKFQELKDKPNKTQDDIKDLGSLKIELNELERLEIKEKLNSHTNNNAKEVSYGLPTSLFKIKSTGEHSRTEAARKIVSLDKSLQDLFARK